MRKSNKHPTYGYPGEPERFCTAHKEGDVIDVKSKKCNKQTVCGYLGGAAKFCIAHKEDDMVNMVCRICPGDNGECPVRTFLFGGDKYCCRVTLMTDVESG